MILPVMHSEWLFLTKSIYDPEIFWVMITALSMLEDIKVAIQGWEQSSEFDGQMIGEIPLGLSCSRSEVKDVRMIFKQLCDCLLKYRR